MFLIGISGSILPYLFVAGLVLIFSVKMSGQPVGDAEEENKGSDRGHVLIYTHTSPEVVPASDFYLSQDLLQKVWNRISDKDQNNNVPDFCRTPVGCMEMYPPFLKPIGSRVPDHSCYLEFLYSGLSPPASVFV